MDEKTCDERKYEEGKSEISYEIHSNAMCVWSTEVNFEEDSQVTSFFSDRLIIEDLIQSEQDPQSLCNQQAQVAPVQSHEYTFGQ